MKPLLADRTAHYLAPFDSRVASDSSWLAPSSSRRSAVYGSKSGKSDTGAC